MFKKFMPAGPPPGSDVYWLKTHGGLGDVVWLYKKAVNFDRPLFLTISQENRARPRRSGALADHLPRVAGWNYDDAAFGPAWHDWTQSADDPACALGKTWAELAVAPNTQTRLECNRWLESGRRLEGWLPDVATTHHFAFDPADPPAVKFTRPAVVVHISGWPDVPNAIWINAIHMIGQVAHVYVVGGSYDCRPRVVYDAVRRNTPVTLLEDVPWPDLVGVLAAGQYCLGHASGFTALADVLRVPGAAFNPRAVPLLVGSWNSPDHPGLVHVDRLDDFEAAAAGIYQKLAGRPAATWPPTLRRGAALTVLPQATDDPAAGAVRAACGGLPRHVAFVYGDPSARADLPAEAIGAVYDGGEVPTAVCLVGAGAAAVAAVYRESARTTRPPAVNLFADTRAADDHNHFDLGVALTGADPAAACNDVRWLWARTRSGGTLLAGGPAAAPAVASLAAALKVEPGEVGGAPGWFYLHRKL